MSVLKGTAYWSCVNHLNTAFENCWCLDLVLEDKNEVKKAKELGLVIAKDKFYKKLDTTFDNVIRLKRDEYNSTGVLNKKPVVLLGTIENNSLFKRLVGNGSEVLVQFKLYKWDNKFGSGMGADLQSILITKLVEFGEADGETFGYTPSKEEDNNVDSSNDAERQQWEDSANEHLSSGDDVPF